MLLNWQTAKPAATSLNAACNYECIRCHVESPARSSPSSRAASSVFSLSGTLWTFKEERPRQRLMVLDGSASSALTQNIFIKSAFNKILLYIFIGQKG